MSVNSERATRNIVAAEIGRRFARMRESSGLTQSDLAAIVGTSQGRISEYERGLMIPGLDVAAIIAAALGESLAEFDGVAAEKK